MKRSLFVALLLVLPLGARAAVQKLVASGGDVEILAIGHPSFIKIAGKGSSPSGELSLNGTTVAGHFKFALDSLDTGIETRNHHMKEKYLDVKDHPDAVLDLTSAKPLNGWSLTKPQLDNAAFDGTLTLHGVTKPVHGTFSVADDTSVNAHFTVKLTDFGVEIPSFAGITVADDVDITVKIDKLKIQ